jgi:hypothetical protein
MMIPRVWGHETPEDGRFQTLSTPGIKEAGVETARNSKSEMARE